MLNAGQKTKNSRNFALFGTLNENIKKLKIFVHSKTKGEELTYDYQLMDIEPSFYTGLECKVWANI
jgi:hypothetical protein